MANKEKKKRLKMANNADDARESRRVAFQNIMARTSSHF